MSRTEVVRHVSQFFPADIWRNRVPEYLDNIRSYREGTRGKPNEIVFLLYHQKDAWRRVAEAKLVGKVERERLQHYWTLFQDIPSDDEFAMRFRKAWMGIQRDLMVRLLLIR